MSATIVWSISQLDVRPAEGALSDVVVIAHWRCTATEDADVGTAYGTCSLPAPSGATFIPYADLTQATVLGWAWDNGVHKPDVEAAVMAQIAYQKNPPIVSLPLPWATA